MVALIRQVIKMEDGTELSPDNNTRIIAMDWQVADGENFRNIVIESLNDKVNLSTIVFTDILDPNTRWFARARALIKDSGWTVWGNLDVMNYQQQLDTIVSDSMPSRVSTPVLTTNSQVDNHDATLFVITATGFSVIGNSTHVATSWFIEDIDNKLVWSSLYNTINKNNIEFREMVLKNDSVYRIRAMFHSSSNDVSSIACYTIRVGTTDTDFDIQTYLDNVDYRSDYEVLANIINEDINSIDWQIIGLANEYAEVFFSKKTTGNEFYKLTIPANTLKDDTTYVLKVRPANIANSSWKFISFRTLNITALDTNLVVTPLDIELAVGESKEITVVSETNDYEAIIGDDTIISYDKATSLITGLAKGTTQLGISAQALGMNESSKIVNVLVTPSIAIDVDYYINGDSSVKLYGTTPVSLNINSNCAAFIFEADGAPAAPGGTATGTNFGANTPFWISYTTPDSNGDFTVTVNGKTNSTSINVLRIYGYATKEDKANFNTKVIHTITVYSHPADQVETLTVSPESFSLKAGKTQALTLKVTNDQTPDTSTDATNFDVLISPDTLGTFDKTTKVFTAGSSAASGYLTFVHNYTGTSSKKAYTSETRSSVTVEELSNYSLSVSKTSVTLKGTASDSIKITTDAPSYKVDASAVTSLANVVNDGNGNVSITAKDVDGSGNITVSIQDDYGTKTSTIRLTTSKVKNYTLSVSPASVSITGTGSTNVTINTTAPSYTVSTTGASSIVNVTDNKNKTLTLTGKSVAGNGVIIVSVTDDTGVKSANISVTTVASAGGGVTESITNANYTLYQNIYNSQNSFNNVTVLKCFVCSFRNNEGTLLKLYEYNGNNIVGNNTPTLYIESIETKTKTVKQYPMKAIVGGGSNTIDDYHTNDSKIKYYIVGNNDANNLHSINLGNNAGYFPKCPVCNAGNMFNVYE